MTDIQLLIGQLDILAPKNPKSQWGEMQRQIIDEAISVLKEYKAIIDGPSSKDKEQEE